MKWTFEIAGLDGDCRLFGVNIFRYSWRDCGETSAVIDPHHGVEKRFHVYEVIIEDRRTASRPENFPMVFSGFICRKHERFLRR